MSAEMEVRAAGLALLGRSRAGQESYYRLPSLRSALEIGRCPDAIVPHPNVFVTHAHLDHAAGIASYASQRTLHDLAPGRVFVPAAVRDDIAAIVEAHRRLEAVPGPYQAEILPASPGDRIAVRPDLVVRVEPSVHRVPTVGYTFLERHRKLRAELSGRSPAEIAARRRAGEDVAVEEEIPLLSYPGDCSVEIFDAAPAILRSRVLLLECTFLRSGEEARARRYGHLHLADVASRAALFENEAIVLTHFSAKYSAEEIRGAIDAMLPGSLRERVTAFF